VREAKVLTLAQAISRMTSLAASQFGIVNRGVLQPGAFADLVVFDPATVRDNATFEQPHQYPTGILHVVVNGVPVLDPKGLTGARPGHTIYGRARAAALTSS
jgi:N-acyl-D-aspartate/D-glutamate deacylase